MHSAISKLKKKLLLKMKHLENRKCQGQGYTEKNFNHLPVPINYDTVN